VHDRLNFMLNSKKPLKVIGLLLVMISFVAPSSNIQAKEFVQCRSNEYMNSWGLCVQSPTFNYYSPTPTLPKFNYYSPTPTLPKFKSFNQSPSYGGTAVCRDGTTSYSMSRSGTCSWHGGVLYWL
jgi:hypothetical protein